MGVNLAARRGAKANRRKAIVAQKRRAEAAQGSLAGQIAQAVKLPIRECLVSESLFEVGMGTLVLARGVTAGPVLFTGFLMDTFCRGVKDTMVHLMEGEELKMALERLNRDDPLKPFPPSCARKLLHDLVQWSGSHDFRPHEDYRTLERLFGDVDPALCDCENEFGLEGKPFYVNGPYDTVVSSRRTIEHLRKELGPDGFEYMIGSPADFE